MTIQAGTNDMTHPLKECTRIALVSWESCHAFIDAATNGKITK